MLVVALAMGMAPLRALRIVTIVEAKFIVEVVCFVGEEECPRVGTRDYLGEGAQVGEAVVATGRDQMLALGITLE